MAFLVVFVELVGACSFLSARNMEEYLVEFAAESWSFVALKLPGFTRAVYSCSEACSRYM